MGVESGGGVPESGTRPRPIPGLGAAGPSDGPRPYVCFWENPDCGVGRMRSSRDSSANGNASCARSGFLAGVMRVVLVACLILCIVGSFLLVRQGVSAVEDAARRLCQACVVACAMVGVSGLATGFSRDRAFIDSQFIPHLTRASLRRWRCRIPSLVERICMVVVLVLALCGVACVCVKRFWGIGAAMDGADVRIIVYGIISAIAIQLCAASWRRAHSRWRNPDGVADHGGNHAVFAMHRRKPAKAVSGLGIRELTEEEMVHRIRSCEGCALPPARPRGGRGSARIWSVPTAGGLHVGEGVVVDSVSVIVTLQRCSRLRVLRRTPETRQLGFVRVRFRDSGGTERNVWSGPIGCGFLAGARVNVYYYLADTEHGVRAIVHDVADVSYPASVESHMVAVHSLELAEIVETEGDASSAGFGRGQWRDAYQKAVANIGYQDDGHPAAVGASEWFEDRSLAGVGREYHAPTPSLLPGLCEPGWEFPSVVMHRHKAVVREVRIIPLFNRFRFCGYGYMALVEFAGERSWAFGDPERASSYLGWNIDDAAAPVVEGMVVTVWSASEYSFVDPGEGNREA